MVGTGTVSGHVAADLALVHGVRRVAVHSRSAERGAAFAESHGFERVFDDVDRMLADPGIDIVYLATPHALHASLAIRALEAGKHVLVEKPIAVDAAEARRIAEAAAVAGRFAMEAMWMRFSPLYQAALAELRAGVIGEVRSVRASFGLPFGPPDSERWSAERSSSTLLDQGVYPVTLALDVLGVPDSVQARGRMRADGVDLAEHVTFEYAADRFAQLGASMVEYLEPTATISGTAGWLTIAAPFWAATSFETRSGGLADALGRSPRRTERERQGFGYLPMLRAVSDAVLDGWLEHPLHPLASSIRTLGVLDRIRFALALGGSHHETHTKEIR
ncbi:Gfo/Idh/MocA family protein [Herbiconiux ginsengi]|uniref:Predicted dehydrogenase n=1 Tax=Herbiconiux ginsengi TaxID=381665 RepID=A0A1H3L7I7_9MICO|nr:Gfo/Idh/MocA family oxidoreductase [Herbiconiux ginsengi]SDY60392.1 Predicted dehydrogenase [Herbiconiux ginsengi]